MPKFSIIVPIYKVEKYISECIESVLNQTYKDFELILVDDGSPDNCPKICDGYALKDYRIKVIHKQNGGLVSARKFGVNQASGDYVLCVDGDDYISKNTLEIVNDILINYSVDVVCFNFCLVYGNKIVESVSQLEAGLYNRVRIEDEIFPFLIEDKYGHYFSNSIWGKVFKIDAYKKFQNLIDDCIKIAEDCACTKPIIFNANMIYVLNECLYYYRQNLESVTKSKKPFDLHDPKRVGQHFEKNIDMNFGDMQQQVYRYVIHLLFNSCYTQFYKKEKYSIIKKELKQIFEDEYYQKAIKNCKYSITNIKGNLAKFCLKHKQFWLMKLYAKLKGK